MFAKRVMRGWFPVLTVALAAGWTGVSFAQEAQPTEPAKPKDIVAVAKQADNLKTFCKLVEAAGLKETLEGKGPFTVFIPTDDAFKKLGTEQLDELQKPENKEQLQRLLKQHIILGHRTLADLKTLKSAKTLARGTVKFTVKEVEETTVVLVDAAKIVKEGGAASNGVIHIIDAVLPVPPKPAHRPGQEPGEEPEQQPAQPSEPQPEPTTPATPQD